MSAQTGDDAPRAATRTGERRGRRAYGSGPAASQYRAVFLGPVGVGKTTAVSVLSDIPPVGTEVPLTGAEVSADAGAKTTTTVGIDYGEWKPMPGVTIALVGTPGQDRFSSVRSTLLTPWTRVVLWLMGDHLDLTAHAREWIDRIGADSLHRVIVAVTRTDDLESARAAIDPVLHDSGAANATVVLADPRDRRSVMDAVSKALDLPEEAPQR